MINRPLPDLRSNFVGTYRSGANRVIRACSNALAAVLALPDLDKCQRTSPRLWPLITRASLIKLSRPAQTRRSLVDRRSISVVATEGTTLIRGSGLIGRLRTCQSFNWSKSSTAVGFRAMSKALHNILFEPKRRCRRAAAKGRRVVDHRLHQLCNPLVNTERGHDRLAVARASRHDA